MTKTTSDNEAWLASWLDGVVAGAATMSQRGLRSIERRGGLDAAVRLASARNVHLVQLTDDKGTKIVAASREPFVTLC